MLEAPDEIVLTKRIKNSFTVVHRWFVHILDVPSKLRSVFYPFFQPKTISISELRCGLNKLNLGQK